MDTTRTLQAGEYSHSTSGTCGIGSIPQQLNDTHRLSVAVAAFGPLQLRKKVRYQYELNRLSLDATTFSRRRRVTGEEDPSNRCSELDHTGFQTYRARRKETEPGQGKKKKKKKGKPGPGPGPGADDVATLAPSTRIKSSQRAKDNQKRMQRMGHSLPRTPQATKYCSVPYPRTVRIDRN